MHLKVVFFGALILICFAAVGLGQRAVLELSSGKSSAGFCMRIVNWGYRPGRQLAGVHLLICGILRSLLLFESAQKGAYHGSASLVAQLHFYHAWPLRMQAR